MLFKNTASQKIHVYAYDSTTGAAKTGDAANITAYVSLDGTANAIDDTNPAEVDSTNMPGIYVFDLTQAETNCDSFALYAKSATSNIRIEPIIGFTTGAAGTLSVSLAANAVSATAIADDAITAAKIANGAIDAATFAADVDAEVAAYVWNAATASYGTAGSYGALIESGNVGGGAVVAASVTGAVGSVAGTIGTLDALNTSLSSTHGAGSWATATGFALASEWTATRAGYIDYLEPNQLQSSIANIAARTTLILADTDELQVAWTNGGRLDLLVDAILEDTGTTLLGYVDCLPATWVVPPTATEVWQLASAIDGKTPQQALRYVAAALAGEISGAGTGTEKAYGLDGTTERVRYTVDADGNRTAVSYDPA